MKTRTAARHRTLTACLLVMLGCGALVAQARVFFRWRGVSASRQAIEAAGGVLAYEAPVSINGGLGQLAVFGFRGSVPAVMLKLNQSLQLQDLAYASGTMAFATLRSGHSVLRWVAVQPERAAATLLFQIEQSPDNEERSRRPPQQRIPALPVFPASEPLFLGLNEDTRLAFEVSRAAAAPEAVRQFYRSELISRGWVSVVNLESDLAFFRKDQHLCCLCVAPSRIPGQTAITLLHKPSE